MRYYIVSDIHSDYVGLKTALWKAGFRKTNPEHILIVCGDLFDRMSNAISVYDFIRSIPKKRRILIKGNHELLYEQLLNKKFPEMHDFRNCTVDTFCQIADMEYMDDFIITTSEYLREGYYYSVGMFQDYEHIDEEQQELWNEIKEKVSHSPVTKWLKSKEWKNYYELGPYIFVHSFIPDVENWRNAKQFVWEKAMWGCPYQLYQSGVFKNEESNGKILVCGHWHTYDGYRALNNDFDTINDMYISDHFIMIDAGIRRNGFGAALMHQQNVLVLDENLLLDKQNSQGYNSSNNERKK